MSDETSQDSKLVELLRDGTLVTAIIAVLVVAAALAMMLLGREIPESMSSIVLLVVGFFFGAGGKSAVALRAEQAETRADALVEAYSQAVDRRAKFEFDRTFVETVGKTELQ